MVRQIGVRLDGAAGPHQVRTPLHRATRPAVEDQVVGLGQGELAEQDILVVGLVLVLGEDVLQTHLQLVDVLGDGIGAPRVLHVAEGRPVDEGLGLQRDVVGGELDRELVAIHGHRVAVSVQVGEAGPTLLGEQQRHRVGARVDVGREGAAQDLLRLRHADVRDEALVRIGVRLGLQLDGVGDPEASRDGGRARDGEARVNLRDGDIALTIVVLIAPDGEAGLEPAGHPPEWIVVLQLIVVFGMLVGDGHVEAVVLAHAQAGEGPRLGVGAHDLELVQHPLALLILAVGQHLHQPDDAHLMRQAPVGGLGAGAALPGGDGGPVEHAAREGHPVAVRLVLDHAERHVGRQVTVVVRGAHRNPVRVELAGVQPLPQRDLVGAGEWRALLHRQVAVVALLEWDLDLQHGDEAHVALVAVGGQGFVTLLDVGKGGVVARLALDLCPLIAAGPVEHAHGVPQVVLVVGPQLEIDERRRARLQIVHLQQERALVVEGRAVVVHHRVNREVHPVGGAVAVVVPVEGVRDVVLIAVLADAVRREAMLILTHLLRAFHAVQLIVVVGVGFERVEIPLLPRVPEARHLHIVRDLVAVRVLLVGVGAQSLLLCVGQAIAVIVALGVRLFLAVARRPEGRGGAGREILGGGLRRRDGNRHDGQGVDGHARGAALGGGARRSMRVPVRPIQHLMRLLRLPLLRLALFMLSALGRHTLGEGVDVVALQQGRDDHRADDDHDEGQVDGPRAAVGHDEAKECQRAQGQADLLTETRRLLRAARQAERAAGAFQGPVGGELPALKAREVGLDVRFPAIAVLLLGIRDVHAQPHREPIAVDPHLPVADGIAELVGRGEMETGREVPVGAEVVLQVRADVVSDLHAVEVEGIPRHTQGFWTIARIGGAAVLLSHLAHVLGADQVGHEVVAWRKGGAIRVDLLPQPADLPTVGLVALDAQLHAVAQLHHAAPIAPQGHLQRALGQIRLALQVHALLAAGAPHIGHGRRRVRRLHHRRGEAIDARLLRAPPGGVHRVPDEGRGRAGGGADGVGQQQHGQRTQRDKQ